MEIMRLGEIPDLEEFEVDPVDLSYEYWTPEKEGESRRLFFLSIEEMEVPDHNDDSKLVNLECARFVQKQANGEFQTIVNASIRLMSIVKKLPPQTPVRITYKGKKKNRTNGNMSDQWSVVTLRKKDGK